MPPAPEEAHALGGGATAPAVEEAGAIPELSAATVAATHRALKPARKRGSPGGSNGIATGCCVDGLSGGMRWAAGIVRGRVR